MPTTPEPRPLTAEAERAGRELLNRHVREGLITRRSANQVLRFAVLFVPATLADLRRNGWSAEQITERFQAERAAATTPLSHTTAELYLAMWAGLQVDYAVFRDQCAARALDARQ